MKNKEVLILSVLLIVFPLVSAVATPINIETFPNHDIMVSALHPGSVYSLIQSFHGKSDASGKYLTTLNSESVDKIDVKVWVKKDNKAIVTKRYDGYLVGSAINLEVYPDSYQKPIPIVNISNETAPANNTINNTIENEAETAAEVPESNSKLTGSAVKEGKSSGKTLYYIIGGIVLLGILGFTSAVILRRREYSPKEIKVRKLSDIQRERQEMKGKSAEEYKRVAEKAEKKVEEMQHEVNKLKNQDKIKQIERRMQQEQEEIRRLRRGY